MSAGNLVPPVDFYLGLWCFLCNMSSWSLSLCIAKAFKTLWVLLEISIRHAWLHLINLLKVRCLLKDSVSNCNLFYCTWFRLVFSLNWECEFNSACKVKWSMGRINRKTIMWSGESSILSSINNGEDIRGRNTFILLRE